MEKAAAEPVRFARYADAGRLAWLPLPGSEGIGFGLAGAAHVAGTARANVVSYPGAVPDGTLEFSAGAGMIDEQVVLNSVAAPDSYVFPLQNSGVTARMGAGGIVEFVELGRPGSGLHPPRVHVGLGHQPALG